MPLVRRRHAGLLIAGVLLSAFPARIAGESRRNQAAVHAAETTLTAIRVAGDIARPVVELTASNALPAPVVGVLEGPARIYLDLRDVRVGAALPTAAGLGVVTRVRAAVHSMSPLVTRVVIDLSESRRHTLDVSQREAGVIRITISPAAIGRAASQAGIAVEGAGAAEGKPGRSSETRSASPPAPRRAAAPDSLPPPGPQYRARVAPIVAQLETVVRVLESIDQRQPVRGEDLDGSAQTLDEVRDELATIQPARDATAVHDTLRSACALAATAVSLARASRGSELPWSASSGAAGALLLFDRVRTALQAR